MGACTIMELPPGFQLEESPPQGNAPKLPPGFQLVDSPKNAKDIIRDMRERGWGSGVDADAIEIGGKVTDVAAKYFAPETAAKFGFAANVGMRAIPALFGGNVAKTAGAPMMESAAKKLMQSAVKPTVQDLLRGKADRAIQTLLDEGVNATKGGMAQLRVSANQITPQIEAAIANSPASVQKSAVGMRLRDTLNQFKNQVNPTADMEAVKRAWIEFRSHPDLIGKQSIPVQLAQKLKQGTYRQLDDKVYGELGGAATEAQKALARGLKEEISAAVPQVAALNKRQSELFNALKVAERRALMQENVNPASLALLANNPQAAVGFLADKSALVKSIVARLLYGGKESIPFAAGAAAGGAYGARDEQPKVNR